MSIPYELLKKSVLEEKVAHLLLFHGSGGEERLRAVLELALMLNCKGSPKPCGECTACKKIQSGNHPDIYIVKPQKASVGIEQVINLQSKIYRKVYEGRYRICLIQEADKLTLPAANALLKIAEEPPENTIIILSASNAQGIIETLRSRAQAVYFSPPNEKEWENQEEAFQLGGGDPDLVRMILEYGVDRVREWHNQYLDFMQTRDLLKIFALFPLEKEECQLLLQVLAETIKQMVVRGEISPQILKEIRMTLELIRRQVNHRLAFEVLAIKYVKLGGTEIGQSGRYSL